MLTRLYIKVREKINVRDNRAPQFDVLLENLNSKNPRKLAVTISDGIEFVDIDDIIRLEADRAYTTFYLKDNKSIVVSRTMKEYEILEQDDFFRRYRLE